MGWTSPIKWLKKLHENQVTKKTFKAILIYTK